MTAISSSTDTPLLRGVGINRAAQAARLSPSSTGRLPSPAADSDLPTRVSLGQRDNRAAVYSIPRTLSGVAHLWSSPARQDDAISALMARNRSLGSYRLNDQWRGLGGALLTRFGQTGEDYSQTLVDDNTVSLAAGLDDLSPEDQAQRTGQILAMQASDLASLDTHASTAGLTIQTRSGQSVELKVSVDSGVGGVVGMKVELHASGSMSADERMAVAQLADGLNRALEGLGRDDAVALDLSGLMSYDTQVIASIDLQANNQLTHQPLGSFSLHLGDDRQSVTLSGGDGELALNVSPNAPASTASAQQRRTAIQRTLDRMDAAGQRGQANVALIEQMKAAFKALQTKADAETETKADDKRKHDSNSTSLEAKVASHLSGLADFEASFGGNTSRSNRRGTTHQAGQVQYQLNQTSTSKGNVKGGQSVAQTTSEQLSSDFKTANGPDAMLDVRMGNHATTRIRDSHTVTTSVESNADRVTHVLRKTENKQLKTVTELVNHRISHQQSWPSQYSRVERLL